MPGRNAPSSSLRKGVPNASALRRRRLAAALAVAAAAVDCRAQMPPREALSAEIPAGWTQVTRRDIGARRLEEYVPHDQDAEHWHEMISVITIDGLRGFDPAEHVTTMNKRYRLACESFRADKLVETTRFERRSASAAYWCSQYRQQNLGEIKFVRYLEGDGRLYVVEHAWRGSPFDIEHPPLTADVQRVWRAQLEAVRVCGPKDACPKGSLQ